MASLFCLRSIKVVIYAALVYQNKLGIERKNRTLNDRKSRIPQIQGIKGEAVVVYCEPLITPEMGYHRLS